MPMVVSWLNPEETVILYKLTAPLTWTEVNKAFDQGIEMMNYALKKYGMEHTIHVFMDMTGIRNIPGGAITEARRALSRTVAPNVGITVMIGASLLIQNIADLASKVVRNSSAWKYKFAPTVEAAWLQIKNPTPQQ